VSNGEERRNLARHARRIVLLMHQPGFKQELLDQARALESETQELKNPAAVAADI
jgi:hypothetical protein